MWEWRIFFHKDQKKIVPSYNEIIALVNSSYLETRCDYYYLINDISLGLKERGSSISVKYKPKLELKILIDKTSWGGELWRKPIREQIRFPVDENIGLNSDQLVRFLSKYNSKGHPKLMQNIETIRQQLATSTIPRMKTKKYRKQVLYSFTHHKNRYNLELEHTIIELGDEIWETIEVEGSSKEAVKFFVKSKFSDTKIVPMGYPQFLLEKSAAHFS